MWMPIRFIPVYANVCFKETKVHSSLPQCVLQRNQDFYHKRKKNSQGKKEFLKSLFAASNKIIIYVILLPKFA